MFVSGDLWADNHCSGVYTAPIRCVHHENNFWSDILFLGVHKVVNGNIFESVSHVVSGPSWYIVLFMCILMIKNSYVWCTPVTEHPRRMNKF